MTPNNDLPQWPTPPGDMASEADEYRFMLESYRMAMMKLRKAVELFTYIKENNWTRADGREKAEEALAEIGPLPPLPDDSP